MNQFPTNANYPERPCYMSITQFLELINISKSYYYERLKILGETPPGKLLCPETQKRLCKIFNVPYFFPNE
jgi:hypothetical protein